MKKCIKIIIIALLLSSCKNLVKEEEKVYPLTRGSITVLPFDNMSNDLTAEDMLRDMVINEFRNKGWIVLSREEVDERLRTIGITDGGQLNGVGIKDLTTLFNTDYLCYGYINEFKLTNLGFIVSRNVELEVKIVNAKDGQVVFDEIGKGSDIKIYLNKDEAKKAFTENLALKLVENITKRPLYKEAKQAVEKIFKKL